MARARKTATLDAPSVRLIEASDDEIAPNEALLETLAQLGEDDDNAKVMAYRIDPKTGQRGYLYTCSPAEFREGGLDDLRDKYGSGAYNIRVYARGGLVTNKRIDIVAPVSHIAPQSDALAGVRSMLDQQSNMLAQSLNAIAAALAGMQSQKAPSMTELIQAVASLHNMMPQQRPSESPLAIVKSALEAVKEMRQLAPVDTGEDPLVSMFGRVVEPLLLKLVDQPAAHDGTVSEAAPAAPAAPTDSAVVKTVPDSLTEAQKVRIFIKQAIDMLVSNAEQNNPHETYAEMLVDNAPTPLLNELSNDADYLEKLAKYNPRVKLYPVWFNRLRDEVKSILTEIEGERISGDVKKDNNASEQSSKAER